MKFSIHPQDCHEFVKLVPAPIVELDNPTSNEKVTLSVVSGGELFGSTSINAVNGNASFVSVAIGKAGVYVLRATAGNNHCDSNSFQVVVDPDIERRKVAQKQADALVAQQAAVAKCVADSKAKAKAEAAPVDNLEKDKPHHHHHHNH